MTEETLINGLHLAAAGSTTAFLDKYPVLKQILTKSKRPGNDWDFS
jgi:hypothetical protein